MQRVLLALILTLGLSIGEGMVKDARAQSAQLEPVAQWGGAATAVAVAEPHIYLGIGPRLAVLDAQDAAEPTELGRSEALPDSVRAIETRDNLAYVAAGRAGLRVFDVADPARPLEISQLATEAPATRLLLQDRFLYVVAGGAGLYVVDLADPRRPTLVGRYQPDDALAAVYVADGRAYLGGRRGLYVADLTSPVAPRPLGFHALPEPVQGVTVVGRYAYVCAFESDRGDDFFVLDVSNLGAIRTITSWADYRETAVITALGNYLLRAGEDGLDVLDVGNRTKPVGIGGLGERSESGGLHWVRDLKLSERRAYLVAQDGSAGAGLYLVDVADPARPVELGHYATPWAVQSVAVSGDHLLAGSGGAHDAQLRVFDVADPGHLAPLGAVPLVNAPASVVEQAMRSVVALDLAAANDWVYLATGQLLVVDATNPREPRQVATLHLPPQPMPSIGGGGSSMMAPNLALRITVTGDRLYAVDAGFGLGVLNVLDVHDPGRPTVAVLYPPPGPDDYIERQAYDSGVAVQGTIGYLPAASASALMLGRATDPPPGLHIVDLTDPDQIHELGFLDIPGEWPQAVAVADDRVYLVTLVEDRPTRRRDYYLHVVDVANPSSPVALARHPLAAGFRGQLRVAGSVSGLAVDGHTVYVAASNGGLAVLRLTIDNGPGTQHIPTR